MGSKDFNMRLVEMVAVSVHQIAVALFKLAPKSHTSEHIKSVTEWQKPAGWFECYGRRTWEEPLFPPPPTHFFHCAYLDFDLYPHGLADVAGYWAEDRILGGVVVFDRGQSGTEVSARSLGTTQGFSFTDHFLPVQGYILTFWEVQRDLSRLVLAGKPADRAGRFLVGQDLSGRVFAAPCCHG